jgi:hypothetical protein
MTTIDQNYIYNKYENTTQQWFGKLIDDKVLYLECGREQRMSIAKNEMTRVLQDQVTIRDIKIEKPYRKLGLFTEFIRRLLVERKLAVSLESVQPDWLKERLDNSKHWILQGRKEDKRFNPAYSRFPSDEDDKNFSLF